MSGFLGPLFCAGNIVQSQSRSLIQSLFLGEPNSPLKAAEQRFSEDFLSGEGAWVDALLLLTAILLLVGLIYHIYTRRSEANRALARDLERRRFLEHVIQSLAHPFYVIDAETYEVLMANDAAKFNAAVGMSTCYKLTHGRDAPCDGEDHACPLQLVKETGEQVIVEHRHVTEAGEPRIFEVHGFPVFDEAGRLEQMIEYTLDITERKAAEAEREKLIHELEKALGEVKTLSGMLPICSACKKVRDDHGYWNQIEEYVSQRSGAQFSHGLCPECAEQLYPGFLDKPQRHA